MAHLLHQSDRNEGDVCNFICPKLTNFSRRRVVNHDPTIGVENDCLRRCRRPPVGVIESYRDLGEKVVSAAKGICGGVWEDDGVARLGSEKALAERGDWSSRGGDGGGFVASAGRLSVSGSGEPRWLTTLDCAALRRLDGSKIARQSAYKAEGGFRISAN
ncbi:hypothetical protein CASFOL_019794 [Castilleja foliolosa]|uniref:Uncharacterized protein n=1 Tax=Castilleja foliolosa TaxID=1961234 RepID=A0ABD3CZV6_9LAMI